MTRSSTRGASALLGTGKTEGQLMSRHTLSGLVARRSFNIHSLAVGPTEHPEISRITVVVDVAELPLEQVTKQLNKLVHVLKIVELERDTSVQRELLMVKVRAEGPSPVSYTHLTLPTKRIV